MKLVFLHGPPAVGKLTINIRDDLGRTWSRDTRLEHADKKLDGVHTPQLTGKYAP